MQIISIMRSKVMNSLKSKKIDNLKAINIFSNLKNYFIEIEYYDKNGLKKIKNNIPLKYVLNKK